MRYQVPDHPWWGMGSKTFTWPLAKLAIGGDDIVIEPSFTLLRILAETWRLRASEIEVVWRRKAVTGTWFTFALRNGRKVGFGCVLREEAGDLEVTLRKRRIILEDTRVRH